MQYLKEQQVGTKRNKKGNKISATDLIEQCDTVFSLMVRKRDGRCMKCGSIKTLQCAHIASRGNMAGRWDMLNALTLCFPCHIRWAHRKPLEFVEWVKVKFPVFYERSQQILHTIKTVSIVDLQETLIELKRQQSIEASPVGIVDLTINPTA